MRPHRLRPPPPRSRPFGPHLRRAAPLPGVAGPRRAPRGQHHRHRRQHHQPGPATRAAPRARWPSSGRPSMSMRWRGSACSIPTIGPEPPNGSPRWSTSSPRSWTPGRPTPLHGRLPESAGRARIRRPRAPRPRRPTGLGRGQGRGGRGQGGPPRLRAVEGGQTRRAVVAVAVGAGPAGLAHRVRGHEPRHPR